MTEKYTFGKALDIGRLDLQRREMAALEVVTPAMLEALTPEELKALAPVRRQIALIVHRRALKERTRRLVEQDRAEDEERAVS